MWITQGLGSQSMLTHVINSSNGLKSSEVYCVFQFDNRLYIQNGQYVSIWNGYEFKHFSSDSLGLGSFYSLVGSIEDSLVVLHGTNSLCLFDGEKWNQMEIPPKTKYAFWQLYMQESLSVYNDDGVKYVLNDDHSAFDQKGKQEIPDALMNIDFRFRLYFEHCKKWLLGFNGSDHTRYSLYDPSNNKNLDLENDEMYVTNTFATEIITNNEGVKYLDEEKRHSYLTNTPIKSWKPNPLELDSSFLVRNVISNSKHEIYHLHQDSLYFLGNTNHASDRNLFEDYKTGYFYDCSHSGVYRRNPYITIFRKEDGDIIDKVHTIVRADNGEVIVGGYGSGLITFSPKDKYATYKSIPSKYSHILPGGCHKDGKSYFFSQQGTKLFSWDGNKTHDIQIEFGDGEEHNNAGYIIRELQNGRLAFGLTQNGLAISDTIIDDRIEARKISKDKGLLLDNVLGIGEDKKGRVWAGRSKQGISIYDMDRDTAYSYLKVKGDSTTFGAMAFAYDNRDCMWLGTEQGLYAVRKASQFNLSQNLFEYATQIHLPNRDRSFITALHIYQDSILVVGSSENQISFVSIPSFHNENTETPYCKQLHFGEDIPGEGVEQNCISSGNGNEIWIDVQNAVCKINMDFWNKRGDGEFTLVSLRSGKQLIGMDEDVIEVDANNPTFTCTYGFLGEAIGDHVCYNISFENSKGEVVYGLDNVDSKIFTIDEITTGDYTLTIEALRNNELFYKEELKVTVPYELPNSVLLGLALLFFVTTLLGGALLYFKQKENQLIQNRLKAELTMVQLRGEKDKQEVQSLIAALNPHFIYNSLNWIQGRYKKDQEFSKVVGRLSDNIRLIFTRAREGTAYHTFQDEINFLKRYLDIQKVRYANNDYIYKLPDPNVLGRFANYNILIMHFQLLFENAIEHGLRNRAGANKVELTLDETEDYIVAKITDDGVGYAKAKAMNSHGTQQGTKMIRKLHEIFNVANETKYEMIIEDKIYEMDGEYFGTQVTVKIPKNYSYEL